jgi:hypothetical protein
VGFGGASGAGVTAWFPLGPREAYVPWYHASAGYVNRVNVTNIYSRNPAEVRAVYTNRTTNMYANNPAVDHVTYVNRAVATTAIPRRVFAAGRPIAGNAVRVDPRQLSQAEVLAHPLVTPMRDIVVTAPARAVPVNAERPVMASHTPDAGGNPRGPYGGSSQMRPSPPAEPARMQGAPAMRPGTMAPGMAMPPQTPQRQPPSA